MEAAQLVFIRGLYFENHLCATFRLNLPFKTTGTDTAGKNV